MPTDIHMTLDPPPGRKLLRYRGDTLTFKLTLDQPAVGHAFLRTNLGQGSITRQQIIGSVDEHIPELGRDWFDIPIPKKTSQHYEITLPLLDVGHFEAKAFFFREGRQNPIWTPGSNLSINVEPADTCCGNIIYNAFIRQFGFNKSGGAYEKNQAQAAGLLDAAGYHVIPPSGTFRDLIRELDFIVDHLGCRFIQLLPIHPTPTTYGRMGRYGSPYASLSFTAVDPSLAEFDAKATPLEQFIELVEAIHARNAKLLLDIAINHTGWAASLHETHPHWLVRNAEGDIEVPGAWGVRWEDLTRLDYQHQDLWQYMADVFLTWCNRGVDGFRCDAGYMLPTPAWKYIVAVVRDQFPDTIFFLEGLGGKISVTRELLDTANFNWAYSELFQNFKRQDIIFQLELAKDISSAEGLFVHYAETHDNPRLASRSQTWAKMRTALCALSSFQGAFGFANGVEWFATEKIDVHHSPSLNWSAPENQVAHIRRLNQLLKYHPAFYDQTQIHVVASAHDDVVMLLRHHPPSKKRLLVVINLDETQSKRIPWPDIEAFDTTRGWLDLMTGETLFPGSEVPTDPMNLSAGQVLCITDDPGDDALIPFVEEGHAHIPDRLIRQHLQAKALEAYHVYHHLGDLGDWDMDAFILELQSDPVAFCRKINTQSKESRVIQWNWPVDCRREVMLPPNHFLLVKAERPFRLKISDGRRVVAVEGSVPSSHGFHWVLVRPFPIPDEHRSLTLGMHVYTENGPVSAEAPLMVLSAAISDLTLSCTRKALAEAAYRTITVNDLGANCFLPIAWGRQNSRYDALLAANIDADFPVDRWMMLTRLRGWIVYQDYSQSINDDCLASFSLDGSLQGTWSFHVPTGCGTHVVLKIRIRLKKDANRVRIEIERCPANGKQGRLPDSEPVEIILRADIENRSFHDNVKAYQGLEEAWPQAISSEIDGFTFRPDGRHTLKVRLPEGQFVHEPEWQYMVHRTEDASRGFDPHGDLFSPGYFKRQIFGNTVTALHASVNPPDEKPDDMALSSPPAKYRADKEDPTNAALPVQKVLETALDQYIVRRGSLHTIIAGYPWFLDWGRDAIIVTRSLIELGRIETAQRILTLFGRFEEKGTLPNMLQGHSTSNRDTSDAPLWFVCACKELAEKEGNLSWLETACGPRNFLAVVQAIVNAYIDGTDNGIQMDPETGLIYSPSHFTWMDTDHPAGTPREGYPIEIQALWYTALRFMGDIEAQEGRWSDLAERVRSSIHQYFWLPSERYFCDCLIAGRGKSARDAVAHDALRPNQVLAVTLGAVDHPDTCRHILETCQELLVPGAIRSLADRPLRHRHEIVYQDRLLCDPHHPYAGRYEGDEDTARKPAYHNGTAWTWLFPSFCEAWLMVFGAEARETAKAWLASGTRLLEKGCLGHVPEIVDGDFPHHQRGCPAQAWGVSEALRVWIKLEQSTGKVGFEGPK